MPFDLIHEMARRLGHDAAYTREQVDALIDELHAEIEANGHARLPGLGTLRRQGEQLAFEPDAELANAVNHRYAGLEQMDVDAPTSEKPYSTERLVGDEPAPSQEPPPVEEPPPAEQEPSTAPQEESPPPAPPDRDEVADEEDEEAYWSAADERSGEHPLGPISDEPYEEADYSVVDDDSDAAPPPPPAGEKEPTVQWQPAGDVEPQESEWAPPPEVSEEEEAEYVEPEPDDEPEEPRREEEVAPPPPPPPAGRRVQRGPNRFQQEQERSYGPWIVGGIFVVALLAVGVWWLVERNQPAGPDQGVAALETAPADTAEAEAVDADTLGEGGQVAPSPQPDTPLRSSQGLVGDEGGYTVVVASETSQSVAENVARQYAGEGYRTGLVVGSSGGVTRYRVGVGQFETIERAEAVRDSMRGGAIPQDAWVTGIQ